MSTIPPYFPLKQLGEVERREIDWAARLPPGDSIATSIWTADPPGLTFAAGQVVGSVTSVVVSGGVPGVTHAITNTVTTVQSYQLIEVVPLSVAPSDADAGAAPGPGEPSISVALRAKFGNRISVRDYGAMGDGIADDTAAIIAAMAGAVAQGEAIVVFPPGNYIVSGRITIPHGVTQVVMDGAKITQTAAFPVFYREGTADTLAHGPNPMTAGGRLVGLAADQSALYAQGDWVLLRCNNLIPTQTAGSRISVIRQVESVSPGVIRLDAPVNRNMTSSLTIRKVFPAPPIRLVGGTIEHVSMDNKAPLVLFFLTLDPEFQGVRIGHNGSTAIMLSNTINGAFEDSHVYDLKDDEDNGHFGYGLALAGACRGFRYSSGTARRLRHAGTTLSTVPGSYPPALQSLVEFRGEPEACVFGPSLWAYDTTNIAFDTHPEGYGILITPHASACFGGVNARATNVYIQDGMLLGCRREGVRISSGTANVPALVPIKAFISGLVIDMVAVDGQNQAIGIRATAPGCEVELEGVMIRGAVVGVEVLDEARLVVRDVTIDGADRLNAVGIDLQGQNADIDGLVIRNAAVGISEAATGAGNTWTRYRTRNVALPVQRVPTYSVDPPAFLAFPGPFANDAAAAASVGVGQAYRRTDNVIVVRAA